MTTANPDDSLQRTRPTAPRPVAQIVLGGVVIPLLVLIGLGILVFRVLGSASADLIVPQNDVLLVRTAPDDAARARGIIASSQGSPSAAPAPRSNVRRDN